MLVCMAPEPFFTLDSCFVTLSFHLVQVLERDLERVVSWLEEKSESVQPLSAVPIKSANIHKAADTHRVRTVFTL